MPRSLHLLAARTVVVSGAAFGGQSLAGRSAGHTTGVLLVCNAPPPQDGRCPDSRRSSMLIENNLITNNNNPNVPLFGLQPAIGTGIEITSSPAHIERASVDGRPCQRRGTYANLPLLLQVLCAACGVCTTGSKYPVQTKLVVLPLPKLLTMPRPCADVPANAFCRM